MRGTVVSRRQSGTMTFCACAADTPIADIPSVPKVYWGKEGLHRSAAAARTHATPSPTRIPVPVALSLPPPRWSPSATPPCRGHSLPNPSPRKTATATAAADAASPVRNPLPLVGKGTVRAAPACISCPLNASTAASGHCHRLGRSPPPRCHVAAPAEIDRTGDATACARGMWMEVCWLRPRQPLPPLPSVRRRQGDEWLASSSAATASCAATVESSFGSAAAGTAWVGYAGGAPGGSGDIPLGGGLGGRWTTSGKPKAASSGRRGQKTARKAKDWAGVARAAVSGAGQASWMAGGRNVSFLLCQLCSHMAVWPPDSKTHECERDLFHRLRFIRTSGPRRSYITRIVVCWKVAARDRPTCGRGRVSFIAGS